ncbi:glycosyl hydrolase [Companilactobacillus heilongjiangensis]|uniref:Glycosyl hydrolase n=2 Tax=Companilactobacillus heilongjiangensis TaxID=1074467 RepID=A0A0K2LG16_9LACO|nr:glycoside hydrolase family 125 protein [Companilactobacillus heilongjiangensis]ALB30128.1 glycosyl hydrolase [Companilactobacillus heilongjiangensis]
MSQVTEKAGAEHADWAKVFNVTYANTLETTVKKIADDDKFILTGDIPAMWQRDSTCQVRPYLVMAQQIPEVSDFIRGVVKRQFFNMNHDPYANAFNSEPNNAGHQKDHTEMTPWIWERKFEIDSLCFPVQLAYLLFKNTGRIDHFDADFVSGIKKMLNVFEIEQHHMTKSEYRFERDDDRPEDTLTHNGLGSPVKETGMIWSAFRPSDDACVYGYLVPANMFAVLVLDYVQEIFSSVLDDAKIVDRAKKLQSEIRSGIEEYGTTTNAAGERIYAYETDGLGNFLIMDDGNVPNLLSAPYLHYVDLDDSTYVNTRKTILSPENPYYYAGKYGKGLGSPHTPKNYIWHIALAIQGLTSNDQAEKARLLENMVQTTAGTNMMHEGFNVDNPKEYTREWFSWANMMYCELFLNYFDYKIKE